MTRATDQATNASGTKQRVSRKAMNRLRYQGTDLATSPVINYGVPLPWPGTTTDGVDDPDTATRDEAMAELDRLVRTDEHPSTVVAAELMRRDRAWIRPIGDDERQLIISAGLAPASETTAARAAAIAVIAIPLIDDDPHEGAIHLLNEEDARLAAKSSLSGALDRFHHAWTMGAEANLLRASEELARTLEQRGWKLPDLEPPAPLSPLLENRTTDTR